MSCRAASGSNWCSHSTAVMPFSDRRRVVLREIAHRHFVTPAHGAGVDVARRRGQPRRIGQQRLEQRRLADAVAADQHDLLAAIDDGAESGMTVVPP